MDLKFSRPLWPNKKGFSLLEIMIVMVIMSGMAVMGSRSIKTAAQNKKKLDARLQTEGVVFDALRLMSTDVEKAFHYQYALYELERQSLADKAQKDQQSGAAANPNPTVTSNGQQIPYVHYTQFIGKENSMHFTTLNNYRTTANAQESDQIEVGYYLATCKGRLTGKESQCLWRRSSSIIDNDVTRDGQATPLVENVTVFKLEYLSEDINLKDWKSSWQTDQNGDATTQNLFPYLVRITLETEDKESKVIGKFRQTVVANVRFTNNSDPAKRFQQTSPSGAPVNGQPGQQPGMPNTGTGQGTGTGPGGLPTGGLVNPNLPQGAH